MLFFFRWCHRHRVYQAHVSSHLYCTFSRLFVVVGGVPFFVFISSIWWNFVRALITVGISTFEHKDITGVQEWVFECMWCVFYLVKHYIHEIFNYLRWSKLILWSFVMHEWIRKKNEEETKNDYYIHTSTNNTPNGKKKIASNGRET